MLVVISNCMYLKHYLLLAVAIKAVIVAAASQGMMQQLYVGNQDSTDDWSIVDVCCAMTL